MKHFLTLLLLSIIPFWAIGQQRIEKFSDDKDEFLKQMGDFITVSKTKEMEDVYDSFKKKWKTGYFTDKEVVKIIELCNEMLNQRLTPSPFFKDYLKTIQVVKKGEYGAVRFERWNQILSFMLRDIEKRKLNPIQNYLDFSYDFFDKNAIRYSDGGTVWIAKTDLFELRYEEKIPFIYFDKLNLTCRNKKDSITIYETSGTFYPNDQVFKGKKGRAQWERFKLNDVYYQIDGEYQIEAKKGSYEIPKGTLHYPSLFPDRDVEGAFEDKLVTENIAEASYPRFKSFDNILKIKNLGPGIEYSGGFRLEGTTVRGYGSRQQQAQIRIYDEKQNIKFRANAELFAIRKGELIAGERVESVIYFSKDSIYHPSVNFRFEIPKRELRLTRGERGSDRNPFQDSYHKTLIDSDKVDWYLEKDSIVIGEKRFSISSVTTRVQLESVKYYDDYEYRRMQATGSTNPIAILKALTEKEKTNILDASFVAKSLNPNFDVQTINSLLYDMAAKGFINYDAENQKVIVKDKVLHYANASLKKVDYDALKLVSETDKSNMSFNFKDKKMTMEGVGRIELSTKQKVGIIPKGNKLIMKENRNMDLDGRLFAGYGVIIGKGYHFDYDKFQIDMDSVRYFDLFIPTGDLDKNGEAVAKGINSRIEYANGVILIDAPNNKSGRDDIQLFPSFQSKGNSFVFYDDRSIQNGTYKRDSFYFKLDKFSFNHMDNFVREDVVFKGTMFSSDIFPNFQEILTLQEDNSLGFKTMTPTAGYPAYRNKGNFKGQILLSNVGFMGKGLINYLGAEINSEDIIFKPKQMLASAKKFDLAEDRVSKVQVPQIKGTDVKIDWRPYRDSMYITTKEKPFEMFKSNDHTLAGTIILTPKGVRGRGLFDWTQGTMKSKLFSFGANSTSADTMDLQIKVVGANALAFDTKNISGKADFDEQVGRFKANTDKISTSMPYNKYQTSMSEFTWDMKGETVTFKSDDKKLATFLSTDPTQDSLSFKGKTAFYNLKNYELKIGGVPFVQTCDAYVYPEKGEVEIKPGGIMTTLENAKIVADTVNKYHVINRATINVKGKKLYTASGFYEYNIGKRKQEILFSDIIGQRVGKGQMSEKKTVTRATGEVTEKDSFLIDYKTEYRGSISLNAESKNLKFQGYASLNSSKLPYKEWFTINCDADKKDLAISYDEPKNYQSEPLRTGVYLSKETGMSYPSILMPLFFRKDRAVLDVRGLLKYNNKSDQFILGDSLKVSNPLKERKGNMMTFSNINGKVNFEGKFNICNGVKAITVNAAGKGDAFFSKPSADSISLQAVDYKTFIDVMAGIDFYIPEKLINVVINDLAAINLEAQEVDYTKDPLFYEKALAEIIPDQGDLNKAIENLKEKPLEIPKKYNKYPLLFSYLPMKWNAELQSFITTRDIVSLASVNGEKVNKQVRAYVEFKMPSNEEDRVYIYINSPTDYVYFFAYIKGVMNMFSNNPKFMEVLGTLKKDELKKKFGDETYEIQATEAGSADNFKNRVIQARLQKTGN